MKIYFVRHGESEANRSRVISNRGSSHGLTALGKHQAGTLANRLEGRGIARIYTSPLLRAVQTAEILGAALGLPFEIAPALREYDCGIIEGHSDAASWDRYHELGRAWENGWWEQRIEGGESYLNVQARFKPFIEQIVSDYQGGSASIVLVGHGGTYRYMLPLVLRNIELDFAIAHTLECARFVIAESRAAGLICTQWGTTLLGD